MCILLYAFSPSSCCSTLRFHSTQSLLHDQQSSSVLSNVVHLSTIVAPQCSSFSSHRPALSSNTLHIPHALLTDMMNQKVALVGDIPFLYRCLRVLLSLATYPPPKPSPPTLTSSATRPGSSSSFSSRDHPISNQGSRAQSRSADQSQSRTNSPAPPSGFLPQQQQQISQASDSLPANVLDLATAAGLVGLDAEMVEELGIWVEADTVLEIGVLVSRFETVFVSHCRTILAESTCKA